MKKNYQTVARTYLANFKKYRDHQIQILPIIIRLESEHVGKYIRTYYVKKKWNIYYKKNNTNKICIYKNNKYTYIHIYVYICTYVVNFIHIIISTLQKIEWTEFKKKNGFAKRVNAYRRAHWKRQEGKN